jgi:histidyl-tRNA synthetase
MPSFNALPGFRDFYPADFAVRAHIMNAWRETARRYGYEEYDGPPLEPLELYIEKSGEEIVRQLYNFEDKGGRAVALRPEMTPSFARMVGARAGGMRKPIRWFSIPQLFRYERTQRGRLREHFQWNVDIVGETNPAADAEILAVALDGLRMLGLTENDIVARFNDRRMLEALLKSAGVPGDRLFAVYGVIDKMGRESRGDSAARLQKEAGLGSDVADRIFAIAEADTWAVGLDTQSAAEAEEHLDRLAAYTAALADLGLADYVRFDPTIVRGLAYYTGIVFEIFDRQGELRAICGGGRYDALLRTVSDTDLPAAGFGMGDVVLAELLRDRGLLADAQTKLDYYIVTVSENERTLQREIAQALRAAGKSVSYSFGTAGVGSSSRTPIARRPRTIVIGPTELAEAS